MKGLAVEIIISRYANMTGVGELVLVGDGIPELTEATPNRPAVRIEPHRAGSQYPDVAVLVEGADSPAAFVVPVPAGGGGGRNWPMASGSWIYSHDSRFPADHPVPLHNRYEVAQ